MDNRRRTVILSRLAERAGGDPSINDLCVVSAELVAVTGAGITVMSDGGGGQLQAGSSDGVSSRLENLQFTLGEGPCLEAHRSGVPVLEPDLAHPSDVRWPGMRSAAIDAGAAAIFGFPLRVGESRLGALDLYRDRPGPLNDDQLADALEMADVAAVALLTMQTDDPASYEDDNVRYLVHQAAGMLSVQVDISVPDALARLRAHAFAHSRPVEDVAGDIVARRLRLG